MQPADFDLRIARSRQMLSAYRAVSEPISIDKLLLVAREVSQLEAVAFNYPQRAATVAALINDWLVYMARVKRHLH